MAFILRRLARFLWPKAKQRWHDRNASKSGAGASTEA